MTAAPIAVTRLPHGADLPLPAYATDGAAGLDLVAALAEPISLAPRDRATIPTGIALALPNGFEGQVRPRSGLAARHGVTVLNSPGTIDADYRGELKVILVNHGAEPFTVQHGMRIAQFVLAPVSRVDWHEVADLPESRRGADGFGSTGMTGGAS